MLIRRPRLEDVPELLHRIQSLLPVEEAARTCILSKSWLHAWDTIPTLRFWLQEDTLIDRTLQRYLQDKIPIESFDLVRYKYCSMAGKWIQTIISKSCIKKLSLTMLDRHTMFKLPDEIFSGENLNEINLVCHGDNKINFFSISSNVAIKCVSLRVLEMYNVKVSEEVINNLLSTCKLLEIVTFSYLKDVNTFKVNNLCYLRELVIDSRENIYMEIGNVPNLHSICYRQRDNGLIFCNHSLTSVKHLTLSGGIIMNAAFFDMIKSQFPSLKSLNISTFRQPTGSLDVTSLTLKRLTLMFLVNEPTRIQVNAPNLLIFGYDGREIPSISFPACVPGKIVYKWVLRNPEDHSLYLKMRETLNVSSKFDIEMDRLRDSDFVNVDIYYIRRNVPVPAINVEKLLFSSCYSDGQSRVLDALFSICHPNYFAYQKLYLKVSEKLNSCKLLLRDMMNLMKMSELKRIEFKNPCTGKWEALNSCYKSSSHDTSSLDWYSLEFKLYWHGGDTGPLARPIRSRKRPVRYEDEWTLGPL